MELTLRIPSSPFMIKVKDILNLDTPVKETLFYFIYIKMAMIRAPKQIITDGNLNVDKL